MGTDNTRDLLISDSFGLVRRKAAPQAGGALLGQLGKTMMSPEEVARLATSPDRAPGDNYVESDQPPFDASQYGDYLYQNATGGTRPERREKSSDGPAGSINDMVNWWLGVVQDPKFRPAAVATLQRFGTKFDDVFGFSRDRGYYVKQGAERGLYDATAKANAWAKANNIDTSKSGSAVMSMGQNIIRKRQQANAKAREGYTKLGGGKSVGFFYRQSPRGPVKWYDPQNPAGTYIGEDKLRQYALQYNNPAIQRELGKAYFGSEATPGDQTDVSGQASLGQASQYTTKTGALNELARQRWLAWHEANKPTGQVQDDAYARIGERVAMAGTPDALVAGMPKAAVEARQAQARVAASKHAEALARQAMDANRASRQARTTGPRHASGVPYSEPAPPQQPKRARMPEVPRPPKPGVTA